MRERERGEREGGGRERERGEREREEREREEREREERQKQDREDGEQENWPCVSDHFRSYKLPQIASTELNSDCAKSIYGLST